MLTLAIDTASEACAACVYDGRGDRVFGSRTEIIGRGHAERLMAVIDAALDEAGVELCDIKRVAVTVGPGSFTGIRVGVATARGLALALGCASVGVSTLEAIGAPAAPRAKTAVLAVIDARRGEVFAQPFEASGAPLAEPMAMTPDEAARLAREFGCALIGSGAPILAASDDRFVVFGDARHADIADVARLAASRSGPLARPKPLYLRGADAKPQAGFALARETTGAA